MHGIYDTCMSFVQMVCYKLVSECEEAQSFEMGVLHTGSHQNSVVKHAWARVVLGWVTSREVLVL
jgi:hypothetical protein